LKRQLKKIFTNLFYKTAEILRGEKHTQKDKHIISPISKTFFSNFSQIIGRREETLPTCSRTAFVVCAKFKFNLSL